MASITSKTPAVKSRGCCLEGGVLTLRVGGLFSFYRLRPEAADYGLGFSLEKIGDPDQPEAYHANVDPQTGRHSCECLGWLRWAKCKHVESLLALFAAGRLPAPAVITPAPARMPQTRYSVEELRDAVNVPTSDADASECAMRRPAARKVAALGNAC